MSRGTVSDTLIRLKAFKRIFLFRPKIDFFPRGNSRVLAQKAPSFQVGILNSFLSIGRRVVKFLWKSFLRANNALTKNFLLKGDFHGSAHVRAIT